MKLHLRTWYETLEAKFLDVRIGPHITTLEVQNAGKQLHLVIGGVVDLVVDEDGVVTSERIVGNKRHYLQTDRDGVLRYMEEKPYVGTGRSPVTLPTGLKMLISGSTDGN